MVSIHACRRPHVTTPSRPNACACRGVAAALRELESGAPGPTGDDAVAARQQLHAEADAAATGQGVLALESAT
ncbi:hypothetical protein [Xanthomonas sp. XNM01]|uniref:hypothetical protein n=1 Tax=Xanthomonas sp. XNM01 TaxID=2769289 RepID=UPI00199A1A28|nr:hypothetical protein [Xanthomonas sp. XNM01]MBD9368840.1 hypothetical protein [Xanthomonas sp. XNM01]